MGIKADKFFRLTAFRNHSYHDKASFHDKKGKNKEEELH